ELFMVSQRRESDGGQPLARGGETARSPQRPSDRSAVPEEGARGGTMGPPAFSYAVEIVELGGEPRLEVVRANVVANRHCARSPLFGRKLESGVDRLGLLHDVEW